MFNNLLTKSLKTIPSSQVHTSWHSPCWKLEKTDPLKAGCSRWGLMEEESPYPREGQEVSQAWWEEVAGKEREFGIEQKPKL